MYRHPAIDRNHRPWVVVSNPGTEDEDIVADFATHFEAVQFVAIWADGADVMKRSDDGTLTTEF